MPTKNKIAKKQPESISRKRVRGTGEASGSALKMTTPIQEEARKTVTVFGSVTLQSIEVSSKVKRRNIRAGQAALERAKKLIITPGVKLKVRKGVPLFHADPEHPSQLVRVLNGKQDKGVFINGKFEIIDP